jgi:peptidoglycan/LPS O-acetylase OafA/YrhL
MSSNGTSKTDFFPALESLRGLSALGVTLFHVGWGFSLAGLGLIANSWLFVDLFFVLSGFVLAHTYSAGLSEQGAVGRFALRRLFRLYPLHLATLLVFVFAHLGLSFVLGPRAETSAFVAANEPFATQLLAHLSLAHAANLTPSTAFNGPSWSIAAEAFAYLAFALIAASPLWRRGRVLAFAGLALLGLVMLQAISPLAGLFSTYDAGVWRALFGFSVGVITQTGLKPAIRLFTARPSLASLAQALGLAAAIAFIASFGMHDPITLAAPLLFAWPILALAAAPQGLPARALSAPPLVWLGTISYSVYLVHYPIALAIGEVMDKLGEKAPPVFGDLAVLAYWVAVIVASAITYRLIEAPARDFGRRLATRTARTAALA